MRNKQKQVGIGHYWPVYRQQEKMSWEDPEGWDAEGGGRGIGMGNTCKSMADSCQCMAKTTTIL